MSWYAAHAIMYFRDGTEDQDVFKVWENILLIEAASREEAFEKGEKRARMDAAVEEELAGWSFAGIRKVVDCFSASSFDNETRPGDGAEITFCQYEIQGRSAISQLAEGKDVLVLASERAEPLPAEEEPTS